MCVTGTSELQDLERATKKILQRISAEPADKIILHKVLAFCETARSYSQIWHEIRSFPEMKVALQPPQVLVKWLVQFGGIEQIVAEDQEPTWRTTPAGRNVVRIEKPGNWLEQLLAREPIYNEIYVQVLQSCVAPKTKGEIESLLRGNRVVDNFKVYASFFIEGLERAGGLEWDKKWRTTQAGRTFIH